MKERMLEKNLIFYNPGKRGTVFTLPAKTYVDSNLIQETIDYLEDETEYPIKMVEERRSKTRPTEYNF